MSERGEWPTQTGYPARTHTKKVFQELIRATGDTTLALYLAGEGTKYRNDTDRELPFRQESNFYYLTGSDIPNSRLICWCTKKGNSEALETTVDELDVTSVLLIPDVDDDDVMWSGMPLSPEEVRKELDIPEVGVESDLKATLDRLPVKHLHLLPDYAFPSEFSDKFETTNKSLLMACQRARLIKTPIEIDLIQRANDVSSRAHEGVMKALGGGDLRSEYEASAVFSYYCARQKAKSLAYEVIAASGASAGTLHYIKNKASFPSTEEGSLLLLDAGCEHENYASDITRTFPVGNGGKFTPEAKAIYQLVEQMQDNAFIQIKPGTNWDDIHLSMHRTAAVGLLELGILRKPQDVLKSDGAVQVQDFGEEPRDDAKNGRESQQLIHEILDSGVTMAFFPHGLGHSLGLDVHDSPIAARPDGPGDNPLLKYLRFRGPLSDGNVITVEPGIYFNPFLLKPFKDCPYIDHDVLKRYMSVGGVRIEDDILVTPNGFHNFTTVKRSVDEIERLCQTKK